MGKRNTGVHPERRIEFRIGFISAMSLRTPPMGT
jgi:hypothetical protein